jgi:adenylate cyclase
MVNLEALRSDIDDEVSAILSSDFAINITETYTVPHSDDGAITFPNLDDKYQGTKIIETAVLYVDMRRSTALSLKHRRHTVARLYSAFVRAMARCAAVFGAEVRGIIGDRVMLLFDAHECFANSVDTAILINSVCKFVLNKHFKHNEVTFGIGIDHGRMLATKTGIRRHGSAQQSYRSLVWLGRPANIASKLTDNANKPEEGFDAIKVRVAYLNTLAGGVIHVNEWPHEFVQHFTHDPARRLMVPHNQTFHSFTCVTERLVTRKATPPILMSAAIYEGFRSARPLAPAIRDGWFGRYDVTIPGHSGEVYGGNVIYVAFKS